MGPIDQSVLEELPPGTLVWVVDDDERGSPEGQAVILGRAGDFIASTRMLYNERKEKPLIHLLFDSHPGQWRDKSGHLQKSWRVMYNNGPGDTYVTKIICQGDNL